MVNLALTRLIMPVRRAILTKSDYQKFRLPWMYLNIPKQLDNKLIKLGVYASPSIGFEPKYISRPISEDEIMAIKLISSSSQPLGKNRVGFSLDAIIFKAIKEDYNEFLKAWKAHEKLANQHIGGSHFDYDKFEHDITEVKKMIADRKSLKDISRRLTRSKKEMQQEIRNHNLMIRYSQNNLCRFFSDKFEITDIFHF